MPTETNKEFWFMLAVVLCATLLTFSGKMDVDKWEYIATGLSGLYVIGRTTLKTVKAAHNGTTPAESLTYSIKDPETKI